MYQTREIEGYTVNLIVSKDGENIRSAAVLVGPEDRPGWRAKDGTVARRQRREVKQKIMAALGLKAKHVRVVARYSCLAVQPDGTIHRHDELGRVIGVHMP